MPRNTRYMTKLSFHNMTLNSPVRCGKVGRCRGRRRVALGAAPSVEHLVGLCFDVDMVFISKAINISPPKKIKKISCEDLELCTLAPPSIKFNDAPKCRSVLKRGMRGSPCGALVEALQRALQGPL